MKINKHTLTSILLLVAFFVAGFFLGSITKNIPFNLTGKVLATEVLVTQVVDGDTITIEGGARIRLIGIDAAEKGEKFYKEAKEFLKNTILHKEVMLEKDKSDKDVYNRYLRYVWLNESLINVEIVREGFAIAKTFEDNEKYQNLIAEAEQEAMEKNLGMWKK